jgi:hypothetical protein
MAIFQLFAAFLALGASHAAKPTPSKSSLNVGMLFVNTTQFLDTGAMDLMAMMSTDYIDLVHVPQPMKGQAVKMNIIWISENGGPVDTTAKVNLMMTASQPPPYETPTNNSTCRRLSKTPQNWTSCSFQVATPITNRRLLSAPSSARLQTTHPRLW